ncbi:MAG: hypothetical protein RL186_37 [Pseudomonadota bacterium]
MRVLILGATGMLGSALCFVLGRGGRFDVTGTARSDALTRLFPTSEHARVLSGVHPLQVGALESLFAHTRPDVVINCVGVIKQVAGAQDEALCMAVNARFPHTLSDHCAKAGARLIHFSTDCVFSGQKGQYVEADPADAIDLYGRSKFLGEIDAPHAITLRTSIIGHELAGGSNGLIGWFLSQRGTVQGFGRAVFSGLPTTYLSEIIANHILPNSALSGLYHVASEPISKLTLLQCVKQIYGLTTEIVPSDDVIIDRSLNGNRFLQATHCHIPAWPELIAHMQQTAHDWDPALRHAHSQKVL